MPATISDKPLFAVVQQGVMVFCDDRAGVIPAADTFAMLVRLGEAMRESTEAAKLFRHTRSWANFRRLLDDLGLDDAHD